jgi:hypothetical protein
VTWDLSSERTTDLHAAARALAHPVTAPPQRHRWFTKRRIAIMLVVDLVIGSVAWHYLTESHPTAVAAAVESVGKDAAHNDWAAVYSQLCSSDRAQIAESDLAGAGQGALLTLGGLNHLTVTHVTPTHVSIGPLHVPAATAAGELVPRIGPPSPYTVTVVRELGGWKVCLSAGGYSSTALGVNVPLGSGQGAGL